MKKVMLVILLILAIMSLSAKQIKNFAELLTALRQGEDASLVIEYGNCKLISDNEESTAPNAIGGMPIDVWEYFAPMSIGNPQAFIVCSQTRLINLNGFVYNYAKLKISDDNSVVLTAQYVLPESFELDMNEKFFTTINDGKNEGAAYLYSD
ncbi:MAG: hypothetical protein K9M99_07025 [Candidatus Cloacimonetes bacterium]|nr:hypothetical protein [Candidatus Cloacimonadota bacterium]